MDLYVKNVTGAPVHVTVDQGRPGSGIVIITFSKKRLKGRGHVMEQRLRTDVPIKIPGVSDPMKVQYIDFIKLQMIAVREPTGDVTVTINGFLQ